jgi:large repetitive protein
VVVDLVPKRVAAGVQFSMKRYALLSGTLRVVVSRKPEFTGALSALSASSLSVQGLVGNPVVLTVLPGFATNGARVNDTVLVDAHRSGAALIADHLVVLTKFVPTSPPSVTFVATPPASTPATTAIFQWSTVGVVDTVECSIDGKAKVNCANAGNSRTITGLKAGVNHRFSILVGNAKGYADWLSYDWSIEDPVGVTITSAPPSSTYTTNKPAFVFATTGNVTMTRCSLDGTAWAACSSPKAYSAQGVGQHIFAVLVENAAGNAMAQDTWMVAAAPAKPTVTFTTTPASGPATNVSFAWSTTGVLDTMTCSLDGAPATACTSPRNATVAATAGAHSLSVTVTNAGGSSTATANWSVVPTAGPTVKITSPAPTSGSVTINYTITGAATTVSCTLDGVAASPACTSGGTWTASGIGPGSHIFVVTVSDGTHPAGTASIGWASGAPGVTITVAPSGTTSSTSASITFTTSGSPTTATCQLDANPATACTSPVNLTGLSLGSHTYKITVTNAAGSNSATASWTVTAGAPTVSITSGPAATTTLTSASFTWSTTGTVTSTQCKLDSGAFAACSSGVTYTALALGAHSFTVQVTNSGMAAPNTGTATASWTINTAPPPPPAPVNTGLPTFTPAGWVPRSGPNGTTGTATTGTWTNNPTGYAYQWYRCKSQTDPATCTAIANANSAGYHAVTADAGPPAMYLRVQVTASNAGGSTSALSNATPATLPS